MDTTSAKPTNTLRTRLSQIFFTHIGSFVAVFVYFDIAGRAAFSLAGIQAGLGIGLAVMSGYMALAFYMKELKYFDYGLWLMLAVGVVSTQAELQPLLFLYQHYSSAIVFLTLGLVALMPLLFGWEPFTYYFARKQVPAWQQRLPDFPAVNRVLTLFWVLIFFIAAGLAAHVPTDWRYTFLYPNLLIFIVGIPAALWLPPLYFKLVPPTFPPTIEALLMGMPWAFQSHAAGNAQATIQFHVSGTETGSYYLRIARGKCESFASVAATPDLTIRTPASVWMSLARQELDGGRALQEGLYTAEGDLSLLLKFGEWFSQESGTQRR
ncbi:MAG: SCP2 sterol-binding domain-containing protein [Deltaproteobacteria bacterium]|nr:SCP2 sterol-binding domain-containing protein [Deltaproteobacteria bacterium]